MATLARILNVSEMRLQARKRLPRMVFDAIDGAADDERTLRANETAYEDLTFVPQVLTNVARVRTGIELFGDPLAMPLILSPTGAAGLAHPEAEIGAARAARDAGIIFTAPTVSTYSVEKIASTVKGPHWFQLYALKDKASTGALIDKAREAGYRVLLFTIDTQVRSNCERDLRNGMKNPPRITLSNALDMVRKAPWVWGRIRGPGWTLPNILDAGSNAPPTARRAVEYMSHIYHPELTWDDVAWVKRRFGGHVLLKGIMSAADARRAHDAGADGIVISNHGGRHLDCLPATIEVLPEIARALEGSKMPVLIDGGIRRGSDIVKALALGATACMIGRPFLWGLAVGGSAGVARVLEILRTELERTLALLGYDDIARLGPESVRDGDSLGKR